MAKVSIILPIYNVSQYLRECLDSVVGQTLKEIEIICVNDGSTDDSLDIINEYAEKDDRIVVITGPNGGYGKAMNKGIDRATGEYIGIVEPDDYVIPEMYEELYETVKKYDLDFVKSDFYRFTRDETGKENLKYEFIDKTKTRYGELLFPKHQPSCIRFMMNTWTGIYRREFIEKYHIRHNETPGASFQDNGFYFQTFVFAERAMILNKPYYRNRRDNPNSSVKSKDKVYCMNQEYDFIRDILMQDQERWEKFQYVYWWRKYHSYMFTYQRIDDSHKVEYIKRMAQEYKRAMELGQLSQNLFCASDWKTINSIIKGTYPEGEKPKAIKKSEGDKLREKYKIIRMLSPYIPLWGKRILLKGLHIYRKLKRKIQSLKGKKWTNHPRISVIVPVYNSEKHLPEMLDSLMKQTFKENFEIIAVNDGSTDRSLEILEDYARKNKKLFVYTQKNQYAGAARNLGMQHARGEYLLFLDSDDFFAPDLLEEAYKAAKRDNADVVMFGANLYNEQTKTFRDGRHLLDMRVVPKKQPFHCMDCPEKIFQISTGCPWTKMFRRKFIKETGLQFQNLHNANDVFFVYSALAMAKSIVTVDKVLVTYREGQKDNLQSSQKRYFVEAYTAWHDKLEELGLLKDLKRSYVNRTLKSCLYNLRAAKDPKVKRQIFDRLHQEVFDRLELFEYDKNYYYHQTNYRELLAIREGNFEKCMELQETQNL